MIVGLAECSHSTPQCNLHMRRLHAAMCEVRSELKAAFHIIRILFYHSTPLEFDGDTKEVLPGQDNRVSPLAQDITLSIARNRRVSALTSLASESEDTETNKRAWSAARITDFASGSLFPDTRRKPSESSTRIDCIVRKATGRKRLGDDSSGLRRRWSCKGGREEIGDK